MRTPIPLIIRGSIAALLLALYTVGLSEHGNISQDTRPEVVGMQFLLPEFIPGCKSTPHVQSEEGSARLRKLDAVVEHLRTSYETKDNVAMRALFTPLDGSTGILTAIEQDFEMFDTISLTFTIDRILVAQYDYAVHLHWEGEWTARGQDTALHQRGLSVFKLTGDQQVTLHTIDGDVTFGIGRREGDRQL